MIYKQFIRLKVVLIVIFLWNTGGNLVKAQQILERRVSLDIRQKPLGFVFKQMEKAGGFVFSYNTNLIPTDSLTTIKVDGIAVADALEMLFHHKYEFSENKNFLVITSPLRSLNIITTDITSDKQTYSISGLIVDGVTGIRLMNVSVYEKRLLVATLTDEHGYFKLKFKTGDPKALTITASKLQFKDASVNFLQSVAITDRAQSADYKTAAENSAGIEKEGLGRFMIGARQKIQSLNIPDFFAKRPFQISLTPGLSTHGLMSSQVVNKFSVNLVGGYTAGVKGFELGGVFNINRLDSKYFQFAGIFNLVGGTVKGVQIAGVSNKSLDSVKGLQLAGYINKAEGLVSGIQISALNNETRKLKGLQIGLVNVADTSYGASIGLLNIIQNGFYKVSLSANDLLNTNLSFTTGTHRFYTTVHAGINLRSSARTVGLGISVGHDFMISDKLYLSAIGDYQMHGQNGLKDNWKQGKLLLNTQLSRHISLYAGPTFRRSSYDVLFNPYPPDPTDVNDYSYYVKRGKYSFGWEAGLAFNSVFKPVQRITRTSENWYMGITAIGGIEINAAKSVYGGELHVLREFNDRFAATLSTGIIAHQPESVMVPALVSGMTYLAYYDIKSLRGMPIKAGIRTYTGKRLFFAGEMGVLFGLNNHQSYVEIHPDQSETSFAYGTTPRSMIVSASAGYSLSRRLETSLKYDSYFSLDMQLVTLRLGYKIKLSK